MHMRMMWIAMIGLVAGARAAHADCARLELGAALITRDHAKIPTGGGILVGLGVATDHKAVKGDPSQNALTVLSKKKLTGLVAEAIAPGLTVYRALPKTARGAIAVQDRGGTRLELTLDGAQGAQLPAPVASAVSLTSTASPRGDSTRVVAAVASVPDAAVALVVYAMKDEEHVPITSGVPAHDRTGPTTVVVFDGGGHCASPLPPGEVAPTAGDEVTLAWVDAYGRLSPISDPVTVK